MEPTFSPKTHLIKNLYLYLVSFVALMMVVFSLADVINIALRAYIFTKADDIPFYGPEMECATPGPTPGTDGKDVPRCISKDEQMQRQKEQQTAQRERDLVRDISMILVGIPLFAYHWWLVRKKETV